MLEIPPTGLQSGSPFAYLSLTEVRGRTPLMLQLVNLQDDTQLFRSDLLVECHNPLYTIEMTVPLPPQGGRVMVVSDGIVEQFGTAPLGTQLAHEPPKQFLIDGVRRSLGAGDADADPVAAVFAAVIAHAGTHRLSDDATAVLVSW